MYRVIKAGNGAPVQNDSDMVTVYYKGSLINGKVFDQTKPEEPAQFPAGGLIPGWVEALSLMKTGDNWELVMPSDLGYGADGAGDAIPPDQTLVFAMTLVKVESRPVRGASGEAGRKRGAKRYPLLPRTPKVARRPYAVAMGRCRA